MTVALYFIIGIAVVGTLAGVVYMSSDNNAATPTTSAIDSSAAQSGQSVDLSSMSPREAADRLFNRVMTAEEQGDKQEVLQFAPKAIQAYNMVENLDADAYYHIGLIHAAVGDFDKVQKQVEILKQVSPGHLLGLIIEHDAAQQSGDMNAAAKASAAFLEAYASEIKTERPEYEAHRNSIESFFAATAGGQTAGSTSASTDETGRGSALFAKNCASCHGWNAEGTDKGPPLAHQTYEPSHHGDDAFYRAVRQGVQSHHWQFGNMPPVAGVTDDEIAQMISYVRAKQVAIGIR